MKLILQFSAVALVAFSLTSCGLPGALVRTAGSAANGLGKLGDSALSAAGY